MSIWKRFRGKIQTAYMTELHGVALHALRSHWPEMEVIRPLTYADKMGVDLAAVGGGDRWECVVQCKGFDPATGHGLQPSHIPQIQKSIDAYIANGPACKTYVLLHNKDGRSIDLELDVAKRLQSIVSSGKSQRTILWNCRSFVEAFEVRLKVLLREELRRNAESRLAKLDEMFRFSSMRLSPMPAIEQPFRLDPTTGEVSFGHKTPCSLDSASLLRPAHKMRFSCLLGAFGSGKTTVGLQAALEHHTEWSALHISSDRLAGALSQQGTNTLFRHFVEVSDVLSALPEDTQHALLGFAADAVVSMLQNPDSHILLIVDGLDESPALQSVAGMASLVNAVGELRSPVIFATRREHFDATVGNFAHAAQLLSRKGSSSRHGILYELLPFSDSDFRGLITRAAAIATPEEQVGLNLLAGHCDSGVLRTALGGLHCHPLFAQMLLEAAAASPDPVDAHFYRRLIPCWIRAKIQRDLSVGRPSAHLFSDLDQATSQLMDLMESVALHHLGKADDGLAMLDTFRIDTVMEIASKIPGLPVLSQTDLVTTTLLVPTSQRTKGVLFIRFFHRFFQEYFTARAALRQFIPPAALPESARRWSTMARQELHGGS